MQSTATAGEEGFLGDRRYLWVNRAGRFVTQRTHPRLAMTSVSINDEGISCAFSGNSWAASYADFIQPVKIKIWNDEVLALSCEGRLNEAMSSYLGLEVRLVQLPGNNRPITDPAAEGFVSFADGFPYLLTTESSLADLNRRLEQPVTMLNFRPNLVIDGCSPFEEDGWQRLSAGEVIFRLVKPCKRCIMTTVDPSSGERSKDGEPLKTLANYRQPEPGQILFGMNMVVEKMGIVSVGDRVKIID